MNRTKWWAGFISVVMVATSVACAEGGDAPDVDSADTAEAQPGFQLSDGQVPQFEPDPLHFELLPNLWVNGQVGGLAVDSHDNVWVLHRPATIPPGEMAAALDPPEADCCIPAPSVLQYDANGEFVQAWGGPGEGYEWFTNEHAIWVDHQDNVWLGGSAESDNHLLKFSSSGEFLLQIGAAGMNTGSNDTENVGGPADLFVYAPTNEVFVADGYGNRRIIVFDADTGAYKRHWGAYGNRPDDALELPSRAEYVRQLAAGEAAPQQFNNPVHGVYVTNDGLVYVADRSHLRIQVFNLDGAFVQEKFIRPGTLNSVGSVHGLATSPDPDQTFLYVADGANAWVHTLDRVTLDVVSRVGGRKGHNAREFFHLHSFASDSRGNLFIGEVNDGHRYYRWRFTGMGAPQNTALPD